MKNTTRIEKIYSIDVARNYVFGQRNTTVPYHGPSKWFGPTGTDGTGVNKFVSFELSGGEVRPKNMAMKIWRRIN